MSHAVDDSVPNTSRLFLINSKYSWITYVSDINYEIITISGTVGHCVLCVPSRQIVLTKPRGIMDPFLFFGVGTCGGLGFNLL